MNRRKFLAAGALAALGAPLLAETPGEAATDAKHIRDVTAYTQVFGEGQKLTHLVVRYDAEIDCRRLSPAAFQVSARTVMAAWTADRPGIDPRHSTETGRYVVLALSLTDPAAPLWVRLPSDGGGPGAGGPKVGDTATSHQVVPALSTVLQAGTVHTAHGAAYSPDPVVVTNTAVRNLIVDDFRQYTYADKATGLTLVYNLYVPKSYRPGRSYPLVLFMHDASVINAGPLAPLVQGTGATAWTGHDCFVLAPAYPAIVIDDDYKPSGYFDATVNLVESLPKQYSIDRNRLHATGQS